MVTKYQPCIVFSAPEEALAVLDTFWRSRNPKKDDEYSKCFIRACAARIMKKPDEPSDPYTTLLGNRSLEYDFYARNNPKNKRDELQRYLRSNELTKTIYLKKRFIYASQAEAYATETMKDIEQHLSFGKSFIPKNVVDAYQAITYRVGSREVVDVLESIVKWLKN